MTEGSELRAFLVVLLVAGAIAVAFALISGIDVDDEPVVAAAPTTAPTSTTTAAPLTDEERLALICERAAQFEQEIEPFAGEPILLMRAGEALYADLAELAPAELAAEYEAALDHYTDFNDIGDFYGYDTEEILREGDGLRWEQLVTRDPFAVNVTRTNIAFLCGVELPPPYAEDPDDFAEIKEDVDRELHPERYTTEPPPDPSGPTEPGPAPAPAPVETAPPA